MLVDIVDRASELVCRASAAFEKQQPILARDFSLKALTLIELVEAELDTNDEHASTLALISLSITSVTMDSLLLQACPYSFKIELIGCQGASVASSDTSRGKTKLGNLKDCNNPPRKSSYSQRNHRSDSL